MVYMKTKTTPMIYSLKPKKGYASASLDVPLIWDHWVSELVPGEVWTGPTEPIPVCVEYPRRSGFKIGDLITGMHLELLCTEKVIELFDMHQTDYWQLFPTEIRDVGAVFGSSSESDKAILEILQASNRHWYLVHPITTFDTLDTEQTVCSGAAMGILAGILKYVFQRNITPPPLFVPKYLSELLVTKKFFDVLKDHDLQGVTGKIIWDQRRGGRWQQPEHVLDLHFTDISNLKSQDKKSQDRR